MGAGTLNFSVAILTNSRATGSPIRNVVFAFDEAVHELGAEPSSKESTQQGIGVQQDSHEKSRKKSSSVR